MNLVYYLDNLKETVSTRTKSSKVRNRALAALQNLYDTNPTKLKYVAKVVDPLQSYTNSTPNDIIYEDMDGYIYGDGSERTMGVKYAAGGFSVGYQISDEETGETSITDYDNTYYSVTFSVNDDLSIGYNHVESDQTGGSLTAEATSYQAAYTMGGATFSIAEVDIENRNYASSDINGTVVSMGLAF